MSGYLVVVLASFFFMMAVAMTAVACYGCQRLISLREE